MTRIFFYGLFMEAALLEEMGLHPEVLGPALLRNYRISIGRKATLTPVPGSSCYGVLIDLPDEEAVALYASPGVADYRPEPVTAVLLQDHSLQHSLCYNLPEETPRGERNPEYSKKLAALAKELGFPSTYAQQIEAEA